METGVEAGKAVQSGSRSRIAAMVSETVSPANAQAAGQHLVQHAAERPDVGALVDRLAARLLRTHVRRRCRGSTPASRRIGAVSVGDCDRSRPRASAARSPWRARSRAPSRCRPA